MGITQSSKVCGGVQTGALTGLASKGGTVERGAWSHEEKMSLLGSRKRGGNSGLGPLGPGLTHVGYARALWSSARIFVSISQGRSGVDEYPATRTCGDGYIERVTHKRCSCDGACSWHGVRGIFFFAVCRHAGNRWCHLEILQ